MSVKQHEPICLDSAQDRFWWMDHFLGDQLQDEWRTAGTGTGIVVDQQTGGIIRLTCGAVLWDAQWLDWSDIRSLLVTKRVAVEFRAKLTQTTDCECRLALFFDGNNDIRFIYTSTGANWFIMCRDGGVGGQLDSGVAADTDYHVFRVECHIHGGSHVHFYIDGVETANSPINANIPDDATDHLQPFVRISNRTALAKSIDVDYCAIRQDR